MFKPLFNKQLVVSYVLAAGIASSVIGTSHIIMYSIDTIKYCNGKCNFPDGIKNIVHLLYGLGMLTLGIYTFKIALQSE